MLAVGVYLARRLKWAYIQHRDTTLRIGVVVNMQGCIMMTTLTRATEYKKACDNVLLSRGKARNAKTAVKLENGSSLAFLKSLRKSKK